MLCYRNVTNYLVIIFLKHSRQSAGSSDRSPQSSSVSHFHQKGMHLSFLHTNYSGEREINQLFGVVIERAPPPMPLTKAGASNCSTGQPASCQWTIGRHKRFIRRDTARHGEVKCWCWWGVCTASLPGWLYSWTCRCADHWPGRSWWDRHTCSLHQGREGRGYCSRRCSSDTGGWALGKRREMF